MKDLPVDLAKRIYHEKYWKPVRADELPEAVRYVLFDGAVNSGPAQAVRWLQRAVNVADDGVIGPKTLAAVASVDPQRLKTVVIAQRLRFLTDLANWHAFSRGWSRRIAGLLMM
jgi:lysozyme family protein